MTRPRLACGHLATFSSRMGKPCLGCRDAERQAECSHRYPLDTRYMGVVGLRHWCSGCGKAMSQNAEPCAEPRCGCHHGTAERWDDCTYPRGGDR